MRGSVSDEFIAFEEEEAELIAVFFKREFTNKFKIRIKINIKHKKSP